MRAVIRRGLGIPAVAGIAIPAVAAIASALLLACTTPAERRAAENARVEKQAAAEINRICALPEAER